MFAQIVVNLTKSLFCGIIWVNEFKPIEMVVGHPLSLNEETKMNENQETYPDNSSGANQTGTSTGESDDAQVNGGESTLNLILKGMARLEAGQSNLEAGQANLEAGQTALDVKVSKLGVKVSELGAEVSAFGTKLEGYDNKISGQDAKIAGQDAKISGQDSKVEAAFIKVDAQDTKFESQNKSIAGQDAKIETQDKAIAGQDVKIENAGFKRLHMIIAFIAATIIFLTQVWILLPDSVKEFLTPSNSGVAGSFLIVFGGTRQMHKIISDTQLFQSISKFGKFLQEKWLYNIRRNGGQVQEKISEI